MWGSLRSLNNNNNNNNSNNNNSNNNITIVIVIVEIRIKILQGASFGMNNLQIKVIGSDIEGRDYNNNTEILCVILFL